MEIREYTVYKFEELPEEAQKKAIEENRDINVDYYWSEPYIWEFKDLLKEHGFEDTEVFWTGFWSQGDGACFTGTLNTGGLLTFLTATKQLKKYPKLVRALKKESIYVNIKITHNFRYYHEYSTTIDDYTEMQDNGNLPEALRKEYDAWYATFDRREANNSSAGWYYDTCRRFYRELEAEYDYHTTEDAVKETLIGMDYNFTIDGKIAD